MPNVMDWSGVWGPNDSPPPAYPQGQNAKDWLATLAKDTDVQHLDMQVYICAEHWTDNDE